MRQTMSDFSLDSLSSLLDDELSLDTPSAPIAQPVVPSPPPIPTQPASIPIALTTGPAAATELVSVTSRLSALTQPPESVRKSSLEETQLYKSTPQPTIDLSMVRRSASEPTQAFSGQSFEPLDASATIPAVVDPSKSSVLETTFWPAADREAADLATVTQPVALAPPAPAEVSFTQPIVDAASAIAPAPALAGFFEAQPRRTTDMRWEQAVESDRQFTTMLLSDMDDVPWRAELPQAANEISPFSASDISPYGAKGDERQANFDSASNAQAAPAPCDSPSLDSPALDVLDVVAVGQAPSNSMSALQQAQSPQDSPAETKSNPAAKFSEPTPELRQLATFLLERSTPGVSTVVALIGCETTRPGAEASLALAAAIADATGVSTLIVDGDFVNRDISCAVDFAAASGFAEALGQPAKGRSYAQSIGRENLSVLPAGNAMPESSEATSRVAAWIAKAKQEFGLILVWLGTGESDFSRRLYGAADATLLLAAIDSDRPSRIEATSERLRSSNARTLGVALVR